MLMEPAYFSVYNLSKPSLFEDIFAMVYNLNSGLLYSSRAMLVVVINCHLLLLENKPILLEESQVNVYRTRTYTTSWMMTKIF
jgi:hypothetical protein